LKKALHNRHSKRNPDALINHAVGWTIKSANIFPQKDTEVLMKTNLNTIFFLYSNPHKEPASLSGQLAVNKTRYDRKITMISRQLIYESKADDVFWVLHTKLQGKKQLARISQDCSH
jgi:hypothetical protein